MNDFFWMAYPAIAGAVNFDVPVVEIACSAAVSGLVTWATIRFSVRAARQETERVLEAQRLTELRAAVLTIAQAGQDRFEDADWRAVEFPADAVAAFIIVQTSGMPGADVAARWALKYTQHEVIADIDEAVAEESNADIGRWMWEQAGPSEALITELSEWLADPKEKAKYLQAKTEIMDRAIKEFTNRRMAEEAANYPEED